MVDSSHGSLKDVLLHNGNIKPCIPIAYSVHLTETYDNMKIIIEAIQYSNTYQWNICGDPKVIGMLMGMQGGFTTSHMAMGLSCRATGDHYIKREWQKRTTFEPGMNSVQFKMISVPSCEVSKN